MFASHSSARVMRAFFSKCTREKKPREKKRLIHPSTLFHSISRVSNTEGTEGAKRCIEAPLLQSSYTPFANYTALQLQHPASAYSIQLIVFHWSFVVHLMSHKFAVYARLCAFFFSSYFVCIYVDMWECLCVCVVRCNGWCVYCIIHCERILLSQFTASKTNNLNEQRTSFSDKTSQFRRGTKKSQHNKFKC